MMDNLATLISVIGAAVVAVFVAFMRGKSKGKSDTIAEVDRHQANATIKTTKDVQDAVEVSRLGGNDGWHDRLQSARPKDK